MAECGDVEAALDREFPGRTAAAFASDPSPDAPGGMSNGAITPLLDEATIRPFDDLVAACGQTFADDRLTRADGIVIAVAMLAISQRLMSRTDILAGLGLELPRICEEVLAVAAATRDTSLAEDPLGAPMKARVNIAPDVNATALGSGGPFHDDDSTPGVGSGAGIEAPGKIEALTALMDPEYLVSASASGPAAVPAGQARHVEPPDQPRGRDGPSGADATNDEAEREVEDLIASTGAPLAIEGGPFATAPWRDGSAVEEMIPDGTAGAAVRVAMEGPDTEMAMVHGADAIRLIAGCAPDAMAMGATEPATATPSPIGDPSMRRMGLMHSAPGDDPDARFTAARSAAETLAAIGQSDTAAAREAGLPR